MAQAFVRFLRVGWVKFLDPRLRDAVLEAEMLVTPGSVGECIAALLER